MKTNSKWLLFSLLMLLFSCERSSIKLKIQKFSSHPVILNMDSMVNARTLIGQLPKRNASAEYVWVDYVDSLECTDCAIKRLLQWRTLIKQNYAYRLDFLFILSPNQHHLKSVLTKLRKDTILNNYIYVDTCNVFTRNNSTIPEERYLHTFLLDRENKIVLVGNPNVNERVESLFQKIINER